MWKRSTLTTLLTYKVKSTSLSLHVSCSMSRSLTFGHKNAVRITAFTNAYHPKLRQMLSAFTPIKFFSLEFIVRIILLNITALIANKNPRFDRRLYRCDIITNFRSEDIHELFVYNRRKTYYRSLSILSLIFIYLLIDNTK